MLRELYNNNNNNRKSRKRRLMFPEQPQLSISDAYANAVTMRQYTVDNRMMMEQFNKRRTTTIQGEGRGKSPDQIYEEYNTLSNNINNTIDVDYDGSSNVKQLLYMKMKNDERGNNSNNNGNSNKPLLNNYEITMKHISKPYSDIQQREEHVLRGNDNNDNNDNDDDDYSSTAIVQQQPSNNNNNKPSSRQQKRNKHNQTSTTHYSHNKSGHSNRLNILQQYISTIESNKTTKNTIIDQKMKQLNNLQMNVDLLTNKLKTLNKEHKSNMKSNRTLLKENDIFTNAGDRACENSIYVNRTVTDYRKELSLMKTQIHTLQTETNTYHNAYIQEDKALVSLKDEVLKYHNMTNLVIKGKESVHNEIMKYNNKINNLKSKINLIENETTQFMHNVDLLVHESEQ